jgi:stage III sporulation protein AE
LLIIVVIIPVFSTICSADEGADKYISEFESIVPDGAFVGDLDMEELQDALGLESFISELLVCLNNEKGKIISFLATLIGSLVLLALSSSVSGPFCTAVTAAVGTVVSISIFFSVYGVFSSVIDAVNEANDFFAALIPITVGITSLGGGAFVAGAQATGMALTSAAVSKLWGTAFTSVSGLGLSMALISAYGGHIADAVSRWVKKTLAWFLGIATAAIAGTLSLQTMVASARDTAAMRAAKYSASGMIPVVGSTVSSALSTLASGISYVKGVVGGGSVFVLISLLLSPLVMILLYRLSLSFVSFLAEFFEVAAASKIFGVYLNSLDNVITVYSVSSLIYVFEIILFVKSGVALL